MNEENKFWLTLLALICATLCCLIVSVALYQAYTNKKAFEQGYEEQSLPGQQGVHWVKRQDTK